VGISLSGVLERFSISGKIWFVRENFNKNRSLFIAGKKLKLTNACDKCNKTFLENC